MAPADAGHEQLADEAAPLDVLLADAAAGPLRRFAPDASTAKFAVALARRPVTTARRLGSLAAELARIGAGTSAHRFLPNESGCGSSPTPSQSRHGPLPLPPQWAQSPSPSQ